MTFAFSPPEQQVVRFYELRNRQTGAIARLLILTMMAIAFNVFSVGKLWNQYKSTKFQPVQAEIVRSDFIEGNTAKGRSSFKLLVFYNYYVNGEKHLGSRVRYHDWGVSDRNSTIQLHLLYSVGSNVTAYYDPSSPGESLLKPGLIPSDGIEIMIVLAGTILVIGGWLIVFDRKPEFDVNAIVETETGWLVRLQELSHLRIIVVTGCISAIMGGVLLGIINGITPLTVEYLVVVLGTVCMIAFVSAALFAKYPVFIIDTQSREIVLPSSTWITPTRVSFDVISHVKIKTVERLARKNKKKYNMHDCVIAWLDYGKVREMVLDTFLDRFAAEDLRDWISEKTGSYLSESTYIPILGRKN